jgi:hypothetical protein
VLTAIHQYGSASWFQRIETKFGPDQTELDGFSIKNIPVEGRYASIADTFGALACVRVVPW